MNKLLALCFLSGVFAVKVTQSSICTFIIHHFNINNYKSNNHRLFDVGKSVCCGQVDSEVDYQVRFGSDQGVS